MTIIVKTPPYSLIIIKYLYNGIFYILVFICFYMILIVFFNSVFPWLSSRCLALPCFFLLCLSLPYLIFMYHWCQIALTFIVSKIMTAQVTVVHLFWSWGSLVLCTDLSLLLILCTLLVGKFIPGLLGIKCYYLHVSVTDEVGGQMLSSFMFVRTEFLSLMPMWDTENLTELQNVKEGPWKII